MFKALKEEIQAIKDKDPAARSTLEIFLCYPGFYAILFHKVSNYLWKRGFKLWARINSNWCRFLTGIEIHPGATIGKRVFIDHGMGVVIGETADIGDDVLIYQGVILGGTTTNKGKRHPTVDKGVVIGAGAKVMGNITIGEYSKIGTGAVVLKDVPPHSTCVGVPGRIVKREGEVKKVDLDHDKLPDPIADMINSIVSRQKESDQHIKFLYEKNEICLINKEDLGD